jgi:hypothetical protein
MSAKTCFSLAAACLWAGGLNCAGAGGLDGIKTVFIILMENHDWSTIEGSPNCPYINTHLLPKGSHARQYYNPPGLHPSEPNYLWLEAGSNFGILNDNPPSSNHLRSTNHLVTLLNNAGISWKAYEENITGTYPPLTDAYPYAVRHNPFVFFDDVATNIAYCTNHVRPYRELAGDLLNNTVARYNFITPNLTNDMHQLDPSTPAITSTRILGDQWLSREIPKLLASQAYNDDGAIFITWDEGANDVSDGPIGMIVLSPHAKGGGYTNSIHYTHSSTLRTMQNIFGVRPYLGDAARAIDLSDLFIHLTLTAAAGQTNGQFQVMLAGLSPGKRTVIQSSTDLWNWNSISTNVALSDTMTFSDDWATDANPRFYRAIQLTDVFVKFALTSPERSPLGQFRFTLTGVTPGRTNVIEASTNLVNWTAISTNVVSTNRVTVTDSGATNHDRRHYRAFQLP